MALLLRKACEPILSDADLDAYHADIHPHTKHMCLYTPCGKQFAVVHGVMFSRLHPTQAEIEYACDLLETWCVRNEKTIDEYVDAFAILQRMEEPKNKFWTKNREALIEIKRSQESYYDQYTQKREYRHEVCGIQITYNNCIVSLNQDLEVSNLAFTTDEGKVPLPKLGIKFDIPKRILAEATARMEELNLYYGAQAKVDNTLKELNSCSN